jgi:hypothetical protein
VWVAGDESTRATIFTKASTTGNGISGLDLYQNRVVVSHEDISGTSTTITDMSMYDGDDDSDIQYTATTSGMALTVYASNELHIKTGKSFAPRRKGNCARKWINNFRYRRNDPYTRFCFIYCWRTNRACGHFYASSSGTFTHNSFPLVFNATNTNKFVTATSSPLGDVVFGGAESTYTFTDNATTTNLYINMYATVTAPALLSIQGNYVNRGGFLHNSGTVRFASTSPQNVVGNLATSSAFSTLTVGGYRTQFASSSAQLGFGRGGDNNV